MKKDMYNKCIALCITLCLTMYNYVYTMYNIKGGQQMSKKKLVAYRFPEQLIYMIEQTAIILNRSESDAVRIMLYRACNYWITKKEVAPEQQSGKNPLIQDTNNDDEFEQQLAAMKEKMKKYR